MGCQVSGLPGELLQRGFDRIEGKLQMPGKRIGAAQRDDAKGAGGMVSKSLEDAVNRAITAAGKEDVCAIGEMSGLRSKGCGGFRGQGPDFESVGAKGLGDMLDRAAMVGASGLRVIEECDAPHENSLGGHPGMPVKEDRAESLWQDLKEFHRRRAR